MYMIKWEIVKEVDVVGGGMTTWNNIRCIDMAAVGNGKFFYLWIQISSKEFKLNSSKEINTPWQKFLVISLKYWKST